jgi:ubiquinone/menaquinone biosynthesis C-methylase UbiE
MTIASAADAVCSLWPPGSRLLDIGCGAGAFVKALFEMGYDASGCEPQAKRVEEARKNAKGAQFAVAGAEALPYPDATFDGCVMVHSLHHVPQALMPRALEEAKRCTKCGGYLTVVEPLPEGSFFEVLRLIDDETEIRNQAQACLREAIGSGRWRHHTSYRWIRRQVFANEQPLIDFAVANDSSRRTIAEKSRPLIAAQFRRSGVLVEGGYAFDQPIRCDVLAIG